MIDMRSLRQRRRKPVAIDRFVQIGGSCPTLCAYRNDIMLTLAHILTGSGGELLNSPANLDVPVSQIVIDSRAATPGSFFVALPGENTDGHAFIEDALHRGAIAALVRRDWYDPHRPMP